MNHGTGDMIMDKKPDYGQKTCLYTVNPEPMMRNSTIVIWLLLMLSVLPEACKKGPVQPEEQPLRERTEYLSGGETTVFDNTSHAYSFPAGNISDLEKHQAGDKGFEATFVAAPAEVNSGLGPVFNDTSCEGCHPGGGRGRPLQPGDNRSQMFLRISVPGENEYGGPRPVPGYGRQLADRAIFGVEPEARINLTYSMHTVTLSGGKEVTLRKPEYQITNEYKTLPADLQTSLRMAPPVFGRGLLEAIPESAVLQHEDVGDANGDNISGKANYVWSSTENKEMLGRFGLKANAASLRDQVVGAYFNDMGITTPDLPMESTHGQMQHDGRDDEPEVSSQTVEEVEFYVATLAVPARRRVDNPQVKQGEQVFKEAGCVSCHIQTFETGELDGVPEVSNQTIHPYTDMLLHDMGEGLADGRPDNRATGREWRTPPLWGIGLTEVVHGEAYYLHDGRARSLLEAVFWHGGEAEEAKERVIDLTTEEREALVAFLRSL